MTARSPDGTEAARKAPWRLILIASAASFLAGVGAGELARRTIGASRPRERLVETRSEGYRFINPLLECDLANNVEFSELRVSKERIARIIAEETARGHITSAAVYFRDLNNGPWFGINELTKFTPASLLKVPLLISYLKWAESDPAVLRKSLCFRRRTDPYRPKFPPAQPLRLGECYPVEELLRRMVVDSDNEAKNLLILDISPQRVQAAYQELGVNFSTSIDDSMTVKAYASFFRILFNASYLSRDMSERALELLSRSGFKTGLRAGVPPDIAVAHKFGEREVGASQQLHDCGIVYYPRHPYLLCVMSRGARLNDLDDVIGAVSRATYEEASRVPQ